MRIAGEEMLGIETKRAARERKSGIRTNADFPENTLHAGSNRAAT